MKYRPAHGHHGPIARARARLAAWLFPRYQEWDGDDDHGNHVGDLLPDVEHGDKTRLHDRQGPPLESPTGGLPVYSDLAAEDVRGPAEPLPGPAHLHDDTPTDVMPAVRLGDGSYAGLRGTITRDVPRPGSAASQGARREPSGPGYLPHAGPPPWRPQRWPVPPRWPAYVQRILDAPIGDVHAALRAPDPDAYLWRCQQRRAIAA